MGGQDERFPRGSFLASLASAPRAAMLELGTARDFEAERVLLRQGEQTTHVHLLVHGCVKVTATTPDGQLALLAIRVGGDLVGELASIDGQPRVATVTTAGRVRTRLVTQAEFHRFLTRNPEVAVALSRSVGMKLRWATRRRIDFGSHEVRIRLARVLLELASGYGVPRGTQVEIGVALTQPELAALVGAAEPTVHRALAGLRREGVVSTGYRRIRLLDHDRLARLAEG